MRFTAVQGEITAYCNRTAPVFETPIVVASIAADWEHRICCPRTCMGGITRIHRYGGAGSLERLIESVAERIAGYRFI
jgi:hypothetical protein